MINIIKTELAVLIFCLCFTPPITAGHFEDGLAAYRHGDYETALTLWIKAAEQGNASAQNNLGSMYSSGTGVQKNS